MSGRNQLDLPRTGVDPIGNVALMSRPAAVTAERVISAPPEAIFDLLATPSRHAELDGSGTVQRARGSSRRVGLGDSFGMSMRWGVPYSTRNVVTEFEEGRLIAWRTLAPAPLSLLFTGRTWRYELSPVEGGTLVRETWDTSTERPLSRALIRERLGGLTRRNMELSLQRIEQVVTGQVAPG
jgi:uncharacterized protein YndB with AHSA1/START domain